MADINKLIEDLSALTVVEAAKLTKMLEDKWGVSTAVLPVAAAVSTGNNDTATNIEEKNDFDVMLVAIGDKKINVIKEVRTITGLGLKEAKELVESAPKIVKENVSKEEANKLKKTLESVGATVELQ